MALFVVDLRRVVRILRFRGKGVYQERMETKTTSTSKHQASCQREVRAAYLNVHMCTGSRSQTLKPKAKFSSNCLLYPPNHVVMLNVVSLVDEVKQPRVLFCPFRSKFCQLAKSPNQRCAPHRAAPSGYSPHAVEQADYFYPRAWYDHTLHR